MEQVKKVFRKIAGRVVEIEDLGNPIVDRNVPLPENQKKEYASDFEERVFESLNHSGDTDKRLALRYHVNKYHSPINWFYHVHNYDMVWGLDDRNQDEEVQDDTDAKVFIHDFNKFCHDYGRLERLYDLNKFYWIDEPNQLLDINQLGRDGLKRMETQNNVVVQK